MPIVLMYADDKAMNFKPLSNHLFIDPLEEEKTTKSGIVIPETAEKERPIRGKVLAVGPGKVNDKGERIPMSVKVGDIVLFKKYGPDEIEIEEKKYLVGDEEDILAILE
jgi:chaperonin GroES